MKCPGCQKDISDKAKFCGYCGFRLESDPPQSDEKPPIDEDLQVDHSPTGVKAVPADPSPTADDDQDDLSSRPTGNFRSYWRTRILLGGAAAFILIATVSILTVLKSEKHYWKKKSWEKNNQRKGTMQARDTLLNTRRENMGEMQRILLISLSSMMQHQKKVFPQLIAYTQSHPEGMYIKEARTEIAEHERILRELKARQKREDSARKAKEAEEKARKEAELAGIPGTYPQSSFRILLEAELFSHSDWELRVMRNEIFARHGYVFKTAAMKNHFKDLDWYRAIEKLPYNNNASDLLSDIEKQNIQLIQKVEKR